MQIHAVQTLTVTLIADNISGSPEWLAPVNLFSQTHHTYSWYPAVCLSPQRSPIFRITINRKYAHLANEKEETRRVVNLILFYGFFLDFTVGWKQQLFVRMVLNC